jgi:hypothetical protein
MSYHDDQYAVARATPGLSPAEDDRLKARADRLNKQEASDGIQMVQKWRAGTAERCNARISEVQTLTEQAWEVRKRLQARDISAKQAAEQIKALRKQHTALVNLAEGIGREVADQDAIFADPLGYIERLYQSYPALQADRPSIYG